MLGLMDGPHTQDTKGVCPIWPVTYPPCLALVFDSLFGIHFCRLYVVHCCFYIIFYPVYHFPLHKQTKQACTSLSPPSAQTVKTGMYQSIIYPSTNSQNRNVPVSSTPAQSKQEHTSVPSTPAQSKQECTSVPSTPAQSKQERTSVPSTPAQSKLECTRAGRWLCLIITLLIS